MNYSKIDAEVHQSICRITYFLKCYLSYLSNSTSSSVVRVLTSIQKTNTFCTPIASVLCFNHLHVLRKIKCEIFDITTKVDYYIIISYCLVSGYYEQMIYTSSDCRFSFILYTTLNNHVVCH